jgi:hypothetical protein
MKVLLLTIAIGENYLVEYNNLFYESQKEYALKNGYDFKVITEFLDKTIQHSSCVSFNKILVCNQEYSNEYDFIIFIDADILININSPPIHNYIDYQGYIGIVDEYSQPSKERRLQIQQKMGWETSAVDYYKLCEFDIQTDMVFNTGVLVLQPKKHGEFLQYVYNKYVTQGISHYRGFHFEQSCIGYEIQNNNLYKVIDNKFNAVWGLTKLDNNENITLNEYFNKNYFIHFAGRTDFDKVKQIQNANVLFQKGSDSSSDFKSSLV